MTVFVAYKIVIIGDSPVIGIFKSLDDARHELERVNNEIYYGKFHWNDTKTDMLNIYDARSRLCIREFEVR
jgi:hypothetical protein